MKELEPDTYEYRRLKSKYPENTRFYIEYYEGDYYNRSITTFYNEHKKQLEIKDNGYYG